MLLSDHKASRSLPINNNTSIVGYGDKAAMETERAMLMHPSNGIRLSRDNNQRIEPGYNAFVPIGIGSSMVIDHY